MTETILLNIILSWCNYPRHPSCSRVAAFAWYSVKIRVIFGVRSERRKVEKSKSV